MRKSFQEFRLLVVYQHNHKEKKCDTKLVSQKRDSDTKNDDTLVSHFSARLYLNLSEMSQ